MDAVYFPPEAKLTNMLYRIAIVSLLFMANAMASEHCLTVVYPQTRAPYDAMFKEILAGIEEGSSWVQNPLAIPADQPDENITAAIIPAKCDARIGLGRLGYRLLNAMSDGVPGVIGAVDIVPGTETSLPVVSLEPDPAELFKRLKHFAPMIKNVHVVIDSPTPMEFIRRAAEKASRLNINLISYEADDLNNAMRLYKTLLVSLDSRADAVWLGAGGANADATLPQVLKLAWQKQIIVFSGQAGYAKRGALFSIRPDNYQLGKQLAGIVSGVVRTAADEALHRVIPLEALITEINRKTAEHIGLQINYSADPYVDDLFPEH